MTDHSKHTEKSELDQTLLVKSEIKDLSAGTILAGRFEIEQVIGKGAFGTVYKAKDLHLNTAIAIKLLNHDHAKDRHVLEQFKNEILLLRQLSHQNIVRVHEYYEDQQNYFITMDWIDGELLSEKIKSNAVHNHEIQSYCEQIIAALQYAQQFDVCHRDLKPENILIGQDNRLYVFDFGMAVFVESTQNGNFAGTPYYCPPEYLQHNKVNETTDYYALGVILYELCCGQLPYKSNDLNELIKEKQEAIKVFPAKNKQLKCFQPIVSQLTAPLVRPRIDHLESALSELTVVKTEKVKNNHGWLLILILVTVVLAGAWHFLKKNDAVVAGESVNQFVSVALLPFNHASDHASHLEWVAESAPEILANQLRSQGKIRLLQTKRTQSVMESLGFKQPLGQKELTVLLELLNADYIVLGKYNPVGQNELQLSVDLVEFIGGEEISQNLLNKVVSDNAVFESLVEAANELRGLFAISEQDKSSYQLSKVDLNLLSKINRMDVAKDSDAIEQDFQTLLKNQPLYVPAWESLYGFYLETGQFEEAEETLTEIIKITQPTQFSHRLAKARLSDFKGDNQTAQTLYETLLEEQPRDEDLLFEVAQFNIRTENLILAKKHLEQLVSLSESHVTALFELAKVSIWLGDTQKAIDEYLVRSLVSANKLKDESFKGTIYNAFGVAYQRLGEVDLAIENYDKALKIRKELDDAKATATSLSNLSTMFAIKGDYVNAEALLTEGAALMDELGDDLSQSKMINKLGVLAEERGAYKDALAHYQNALNIRMNLDEKWLQAESMNNVGFMFFLLSQMDHAVIYWQQAEQIYQELSDPVGVLQVKQNLAQLLLRKGQINEAFTAFESTLNQANQLELVIEPLVAKANLAKIAFIQGRFQFAIDELTKVIETLQKRDDVRGQIEFGLWLAEWYIILGDHDSSLTQLSIITDIGEDAMSKAQIQLFKLLNQIITDNQVETDLAELASEISDYEKIHLYLLLINHSLSTDPEKVALLFKGLSSLNVKLYKIEYLLLLELKLKFMAMNGDWQGFGSYMNEANKLLKNYPIYWRNYHFGVLNHLELLQQGNSEETLEQILEHGWEEIEREVPDLAKGSFVEVQTRIYGEIYERSIK